MPEPNVTDWFPSLSLLPTSPGKGAPAPGGAAQIPRHPGAASTLPSFVRPDRPHRASDPALPGTAHPQPGTTSSTPARAAAREQGAELCVCLCPAAVEATRKPRRTQRETSSPGVVAARSHLLKSSTGFTRPSATHAGRSSDSGRKRGGQVRLFKLKQIQRVSTSNHRSIPAPS